MVGGALVTADDELAERLRFLQNAVGRRAGSDGLLARAARHQDAGGAHGAPRAERACAGRAPGRARRSRARVLPGPAESSAARAREAPGERVRRHDLVRPRRRSLEAGRRVFDRFKLFTRAESLGGVESLVCHPASMTHASVPRETSARDRLRGRPAATLGRDRGLGRPSRRFDLGFARSMMASCYSPIGCRLGERFWLTPGGSSHSLSPLWARNERGPMTRASCSTSRG